MRDAYLSKHDSFGLEYVDMSEDGVDKLRSAVLQLPFLVSKKLVIVSSLFISKQGMDEFEKILGGIPSEIDVVCSEAKPDKRTKLFKLLDKTVSVIKADPLDAMSIEKWIMSTSSKLGFDMPRDMAHYVMSRGGTDQLRLSKDIEVLALQHIPITKELIDSVVEPTLQASTFELLEALFSGRSDAAMSVCEQLFISHTEPLEIVAMIAWQLHICCVIKAAQNKPAADIARVAKIHPFVVSKSTSITRKVRMIQLQQALERVISAEVKLKTSPVPAEDVLRVLLLEIAETIS